MQPSEIRKKVLSDHAVLRERLDALEALTRAAEGAGDSASAREELRLAGERFHEMLAQHMRWEDEHLGPALLEADAWGPERLARLRQEHREQREELAAFVESLHDPDRSTRELGAVLRDLAAWLRRDMQGEETESVNAKVLRDDPIAVDVEAG